DTENHQKLQAETLKVWLLPADPDAPAGAETQKLRPHHLKATHNVRAHSAELLIREPTENLTIWFKDVPARPAAETPAAVAPPAATMPPAGATATPPARPDAAPNPGGKP